MLLVVEDFLAHGRFVERLLGYGSEKISILLSQSRALKRSNKSARGVRGPGLGSVVPASVTGDLLNRMVARVIMWRACLPCM
jgi:hypothetical protein